MVWGTSDNAARGLRPARSTWRSAAALGMALVAICVAAPAEAASLSAQELQTIARALAFLQPPPTSGDIGIVYNANDPASRRDAEAINDEIGAGLQIGKVRLPPRLVEAGALAGGGFAVALAAAGANGPALGAAIRASHVLCVTAELAAVQAGFCTMAISTEIRVQIVLNHAAAAASDINFIAAFRMMIHEI
jgi:hypothetical protein